MRLRNIKGATEAIESSPYCIQAPAEMKNHWREFFGNDNPIHIEVGMGKGRFLMNLAALHPDINYIGIERYTSVLFRAIQKMEEAPLPNVHFICMDADELPEVFDEKSIDKIYLNFSDPWPKERHAKRRLTHGNFLRLYRQVLKMGGQIHFKTDNAALFEWSLGEFEACGLEIRNLTRNLHENGPVGIMTGYEEKFYALGTPINRCELINHGVLPDPEPAEKDEQTGIL